VSCCVLLLDSGNYRAAALNSRSEAFWACFGHTIQIVGGSLCHSKPGQCPTKVSCPRCRHEHHNASPLSQEEDRTRPIRILLNKF